jgi:hypothetical protein
MVPSAGQRAPVSGVSRRRPATLAPPPAGPGKAEIFRAVPGGSRRAESQRAYLAALVADPELAELRADARRSVLEVARVLARWATWRTMTAWRPRARICAEVGSSRDPDRPLSVSAFKSCRRWLETHGYLGLVEGGTTPLFRAGVLADPCEQNRCPVYVLATPRRRCRIRKPADSLLVNRPLPRSRRDLGIAPRARDLHPKIKSKKARAPRGQSDLPPGASALHRCPRTRSEALAVAAAVQARSRHLGRISAEHLRHVARSFFAAGWTGADVLAAIDHEPGGRQHGYVSGIRSPGRWAAYRLGLWLGPDGLPVASRSQLAAAARKRDQADQVRRRAERKAPAGYAEGAAAARAMLTARLAGLRSAGRLPSGLPPRSPRGAGPARSPQPP